MPTRIPILGLILAGGLGRRMGGAQKALIGLGGARLVDRVVARTQGQCRAIALNLHDIAPEMTAPYASLGLPFVADGVAGHAGPLAGVLGGLDHAARMGLQYVASFPCDCPFLPRDLVGRLLAAALDSHDGFARASSAGRTHYVAALWPVACRDALRLALTEAGVRKVDDFQRRYDVATVEWAVGARDPFFNINGLDDLREAEKWLEESD